AGLPEGTITTDSAGNRLLITYQGGDGNDVVETAVPMSDLVGRVKDNGQVWTGVSNGSSFNSSIWATWNPNVTWVDSVTGDFNGDGLTDIAARDATTGNWYVGLSTDSSYTTSLWTNWNPNVTWVDVQVGNFTGQDFNGKGFTDIIGRVQETGQWYVAQPGG